MHVLILKEVTAILVDQWFDLFYFSFTVLGALTAQLNYA